VLLAAYVAYVVYGVFGVEGRRAVRPEREQEGSEERTADRGPRWSARLSTGVLVAAAVALIPVTDTLTTSVTPVTHDLGWSQVFVGMVIVANAGNAAEAYAAIRLAVTRPASPRAGEESGLDLAFGI